jgi:hypothetical protein
MDDIGKVLGSDAPNEAKSRMRIDNLIIKSVATELLRFEQATDADVSRGSRYF